MAEAPKTRAELREEIVALISECDYKDEKPNAYIVRESNREITTESFCRRRAPYVIVHASCDLAAFLVVLDHLNDDDQAMVYECLVAHREGSEVLYDCDVLFVFDEFFYCDKYFPEEFLHLNENGQGRSIKPAR